MMMCRGKSVMCRGKPAIRVETVFSIGALREIDVDIHDEEVGGWTAEVE